jgi:hypothetical protein
MRVFDEAVHARSDSGCKCKPSLLTTNGKSIKRDLEVDP